MTELELLDDLYALLKELFKGYVLLNKDGVLQEIKIFRQNIPEPEGVTKEAKGITNYSDSDYSTNFPSIIIKLGEVTDKEENRLDQSQIKIKFITAIYDKEAESEAYRDILNIHEIIREYFLINRVTANKFRLDMPLHSRLLDADTWPVYFGEMDFIFDIGRPLMRKDFVAIPQMSNRTGDIHERRPY